MRQMFRIRQGGLRPYWMMGEARAHGVANVVVNFGTIQCHYNFCYSRDDHSMKLDALPAVIADDEIAFKRSQHQGTKMPPITLRP